MNNTRTERIAIHESARIFSKFNWMFREQIGGDFGVDAIAEKISNGKPDGSFIALQIKGSAKFRHGKKCLYFYFSTSHYNYWLSVAKGMPFFLFFAIYRIRKFIGNSY